MNDNEKEENQFKQKFDRIKNNLNNIESLINMLLVALDNDFEPPQISDIVDYIFIIKDYLKEQKQLLNDFINELNLPDGKAKLLLLRTIHFNKED